MIFALCISSTAIYEYIHLIEARQNERERERVALRVSRDTFKTGCIFPSSITADVKCVSTFRANARNEAREDQMSALYFQDVFAIKAVFTNFSERPGSRPGRIGARGTRAEDREVGRKFAKNFLSKLGVREKQMDGKGTVYKAE